MAVARIFTRHLESATSLSEELRRKGYTVEVIVQDQPPLRKDQDVEIDFEFLRRAESPTYSEEIITEFVPDTMALAAARGPLTLAGTTPPRIIDVPVDALDSVHVPVQMPAMPPVAILDSPQRIFLQNENLENENLENEDLHAQDEASQQAARREYENRGWENRISVPRDAGLSNDFAPAPVMNGDPHDHKSAPLALLAGVENLAHRIAKASREQINLRTTRMREARHQRQLALEARQIRDEERAAELQAARDAAAERLQGLLRERGDEVPQPVVAQFSAEMEIESEATLVGAAPEPPRPAVVRAPIAAFQPPLWKQLLFKPEFIFASAAAMGSIVVVGLALTSFRPRVTAKLDEPAVATAAQNSAVTTSASKSAKPARVARSRSGKPSLAAVDHITTRHLGDDVTIRLYPQGSLSHGFAQTKPAANNHAQPELRRISDLEN